MLPFDSAFLNGIRNNENKKVIISVLLDNGIEKKYIGKLKISDINKTIIILNDSREITPVSGMDSDFKIQFLRASPLITLMNWEKYFKGEFMKRTESDDQFMVKSFTIYPQN